MSHEGHQGLKIQWSRQGLLPHLVQRRECRDLALQPISDADAPGLGADRGIRTGVPEADLMVPPAVAVALSTLLVVGVARLHSMLAEDTGDMIVCSRSGVDGND